MEEQPILRLEGQTAAIELICAMAFSEVSEGDPLRRQKVREAI